MADRFSMTRERKGADQRRPANTIVRVYCFLNLFLDFRLFFFCLFHDLRAVSSVCPLPDTHTQQQKRP